MSFVDDLKEVFVHNIVVISGVRPCGRSVNMMRCGRQSYGLLYIWNGEASFYLEDKREVKVTNGQLIYLPKNARYKMEYTAENTTFVVVNFDLLSEGVNPFEAHDFCVVAKDDTLHAIANIMSKFELCGAVQNVSGLFRKSELFYRLLSLIHNSNPSIESGQYPQIVKGVMLLKQTYLENLPIEEFAKHSNVSVGTFRQLFFKQYGMPPLQYRNMLRIQRAKQLLEYDNCTVAEVAYASGFDNIGYFCRYYKRLTGETPKQTKERSV